MLKKLKVLLLLAGLGAMAAGTAACAMMTAPEQYQNQGYDITVTYDPNGGSFLGRDGVTLVDMFNPDNYTADANGVKHIKLTSPTDPSRETGNESNMTLTRNGYSFYGWFKERTLRTNSAGDPIDYDGNVLHEASDGTYYYIASDGSQVAADLSYSFAEPWDFTTDTLSYSDEDGQVSLTLYASWVPYFTFNYYYQNDGEWELYNSEQYFDYISVNAEGSKSSADTVLLPDWEEYDEVYGGTGAMVYEHAYQSGGTFTFPSVDGYTFVAAYTDPECTPESRIEDGFAHTGKVNEDGTVSGRVQNIYVDFEEGVRYRIKDATQLSENGDPEGLYEILADLDFESDAEKPIAWPGALSLREFTGRFEAVGGEWTISNVSFSHNNGSILYGGLFGYVAKEAVITGITFENVTFDIQNVANDRVKPLYIGLLAGYIEEGAEVDVTIGNAVVRMNNKLTPGTMYSFNLLLNGQTAGVSRSGDITFIIYGEYLLENQYRYALPFTKDEDGNDVAPDASVDEDGLVEITFGGLVYSSEKEYLITIWRNNHEQ